MLPHLRVGRLRRRAEGRPGQGRCRGDARACGLAPDRAPGQRGRSVSSAGPVVLLGLSGWAFTNWRRFGKDPVYTDDASVLMPAPPPELTAASGAMIMDGGTSRRALTTAMLDLASRGLIAFREDPGGLLSSKKVGVDTDPGSGRRRRRGTARAERAPADRARRATGTAATFATLGLGEDGEFITPGRAAQVRDERRRLRQGARGARRQPRLVHGEAEQGRRRAGPAGARWPSAPASSRSSPDSTSRSPG